MCKLLFPVPAEWQALRPTTGRTFPVVFVEMRRFLKHVGHWGLNGDASCGDYTDDVREELVAV
jgi:hypothetical protein